METQTHLITYEESLLMPENKFEEILDGVSRIMPMPTVGHMRFVRTLSGELERVLPEYDVCREPYGLGIRRSPFRYRGPDISVFAPVLSRLSTRIRKDAVKTNARSRSYITPWRRRSD